MYVDILMDGRKIDDYSPKGMNEIDPVVKGGDREFDSQENILQATIVDPVYPFCHSLIPCLCHPL